MYTLKVGSFCVVIQSLLNDHTVVCPPIRDHPTADFHRGHYLPSSRGAVRVRPMELQDSQLLLRSHRWCQYHVGASDIRSVHTAEIGRKDCSVRTNHLLWTHESRAQGQATTGEVRVDQTHRHVHLLPGPSSMFVLLACVACSHSWAPCSSTPWRVVLFMVCTIAILPR